MAKFSTKAGATTTKFVNGKKQSPTTLHAIWAASDDSYVPTYSLGYEHSL